ncbi:methyl-accepting chemotaxis protein [Anaerosporobacter faecicola]|uniref:methyl-accepting chemotaxis protein n=1 Tax=Anaerosporobacter faecicola TaxID=2718714 RepID=UPI001438E7D8|nr:methyl-accepting chemotaxis protein [Anaerosporobacter faecicola]
MKMNRMKEKQTKEKQTKERYTKEKRIKIFGIRAKLMLGFIIPICFIIALGGISYYIASKAIISLYENSAVSNINMAEKYLTQGFSQAESTSFQYINDDMIMRNFSKYQDAKETEMVVNAKTIKKNILAKIKADEFIEAIHLIGEDSLVSTIVGSKSGMLSQIIDTETGKKLIEAKAGFLWSTSDEIDTILDNLSENYYMRIIRRTEDNNGLVMIDMKESTILDTIQEIDYGKDSYVAVISEDGKELLNKPELKDSDQPMFYNQDFYEKAINSEEDGASSYVECKGKKYLFIYKKIGDTGATLCAMIDKEHIVSQPQNIKQATYIIVAIAVLVSIIISIGIATDFARIIHKLIHGMKKASDGDLTTKITTKRKDEFGELSGSMNRMFQNMKELVLQVEYLSGVVMNSVKNVTESTEVFVEASNNIIHAQEKIEDGVGRQSGETQSCTSQMQILSEHVEVVNKNAQEIESIVCTTTDAIHSGMSKMEDLQRRTSKTSKISSQIIQNIYELSEEANSINKVIQVINGIAEQTELLSLNASIEAARAGEAGKGFAVVASEINKLAAQSMEAAKQTNILIDGIHMRTNGTVDTAKEVEQVVESQEYVVNETMEAFDHISDQVGTLVDKMNDIINNINDIEQIKKQTENSMVAIQIVSTENEQSVNEVNTVVQMQKLAVEQLQETAEELDQNSRELVEAIHVFQCEQDEKAETVKTRKKHKKI